MWGLFYLFLNKSLRIKYAYIIQLCHKYNTLDKLIWKYSQSGFIGEI